MNDGEAMSWGTIQAMHNFTGRNRVSDRDKERAAWLRNEANRILALADEMDPQ